MGAEPPPIFTLSHQAEDVLARMAVLEEEIAALEARRTALQEEA